MKKLALDRLANGQSPKRTLRPCVLAEDVDRMHVLNDHIELIPNRFAILTDTDDIMGRWLNSPGYLYENGYQGAVEHCIIQTCKLNSFSSATMRWIGSGRLPTFAANGARRVRAAFAGT